MFLPQSVAIAQQKRRNKSSESGKADNIYHNGVFLGLVYNV